LGELRHVEISGGSCVRRSPYFRSAGGRRAIAKQGYFFVGGKYAPVGWTTLRP
jgi:hypothetical protein